MLLFEPLEEAFLENLTRNTVFLIVLAFGRCCSEVDSFPGLPSAVRFSDAQDRVTLTELPGFLAKNQAPAGSSPLVEIPALTTPEGTFDLDRSLCPVRALKLYLERLCVPWVSAMSVFESGPCGYQRDPCGLHHEVDAVCCLRCLRLS